MNTSVHEVDNESGEEDKPLAAGMLRPASIGEELWNQIPDDLKREAVERAGWIGMRKFMSTPKLMQLALSGMDADMSMLEVEPPWSLVRDLMQFAPTPRRDRDGHVDPDILELAAAMENEARWAYREGMVGVAPDPDRRRTGDMAANRKRLVMERVFELVSVYGPVSNDSLA